MVKLFRALLFAAIGLLALAVAVAGLAYALITRSLPDYDADYVLPHTVGDIEIIRDRFAIPHIFAATDSDVFFGLGFVHAQDRLWQMTMLRRTADGRLAELFGEQALAHDLMMRQLDLTGLARATLPHQSGRTIAFLDAYANGVNAWLDIVNAQAKGRGAPEFFLFSAKLRPWEAADSLAIMLLMAFRLADHADDELLRLALLDRIDQTRLFDIMPSNPRPPQLSPIGPIMPTDQASTAPMRPRFGASNAWAVAPRLSASGGSLLAGDPHLDFTAPSQWMLARLELSSGGVIGATVPGMPIMPNGRSETLGWAVTASYLDDQDLYFERLDPNDDERYLSADGYRQFESRWTTIPIAGGGERRYLLRWTQNGPLLPNAWLASRAVAASTPISMAWTTLDPRNRSMTAAIDLMMAHDVAQALTATKPFRSPSLNLILADRERIAMQVLGAAPDRDAEHETRGTMPAAGWRPVNLWQGILAHDTLPRLLDPADGYVANTNNRTSRLPYPRHVSHSWGDSQRIRRLHQLIGAQDIHSSTSFMDMQLDTQSVAARTILPLLLNIPVSPTPGEASAQQRELRQQALSALRNWSGEMNSDLPQPLIYSHWLRALNEGLIRDDLGSLADAMRDVAPEFIERVMRNIDGASAWCDNRLTSQTETCPQIVAQALDAALADLAAQYGNQLSRWRWGDRHLTTHRHPVLGRSPTLSWISDIQHAASGGTHTLNRSALSESGINPDLGIHGPGYRGIYDMAEPGESHFVISTGQSGHPLSRHYDDLNQLWRQGRYVTMSLDRERAQSLAVGTTLITRQESDP